LTAIKQLRSAFGMETDLININQRQPLFPRSGSWSDDDIIPSSPLFTEVSLLTCATMKDQTPEIFRVEGAAHEP